MDAVGHVSDRHIVRRPTRKERPKEAPAGFPEGRHILHTKTLGINVDWASPMP